MRSLAWSSRRLFGLLGLFAGVPLVLLVLLPLQMATRSLGSEATSRVADTAAVSANAVSLQMQGLAGITQSFATRPELVSTSPIPMSDPANPIRGTLAQLQTAYPNVRSASLLDPTGHVVSAAPYSNVQLGRDISYRDYYKGAVNSTQPHVSETFISAVSPYPKLVAVSLAIRGPADPVTGQKPVLGVLVVSVDVTAVFQSYVDNFKAESGVSLTIVDQSNDVVSMPGFGPQVMKLDDPGFAKARLGQTDSHTASSQGRSIVIAYQSVGTTNWAVGASVPRSSAFAAINEFRERVIIIALILGSVICVALGLLYRSVHPREQVDQALRFSEERNRKVVETVRQAVFELDTEMHVTDWNAQAEVTFGWTRDEIIGKPFLQTLVPADKRESLQSNIVAVVEEQGAPMRRFTLHNSLLSKSGLSVPVEIALWATDVVGQRRVNIFAQDISERVRLEEEREVVMKRQARLVEELRRADKAKTDFISTISHELRTPLTSIVGYLEMLNDGYGGELTANATSMLDVIDRNSRRLLGLIEDVLTLSRIESGAFAKGDDVAIDVAGLIQGAAQTFVPSARSKSLDLEVDAPRDAGFVRGDPNQLERVLLNLISNAVKFTPPEGRVSITSYDHEGKVVITVHDTGIGIPVEEQHKLFSRFFRASTAHDQAIQGTGLGLTIVKSIVERHGGTISVQSAVGSGTTVTVELDLVDADSLSSLGHF